MEATQDAHRALLATGIAGAFLASLAAGPANAAHGYMMTEHPLRGQFPPAASQDAPAAAASRSAATVKPKTTASGYRASKSGAWLRGDFPTAASQALPPASERQLASVYKPKNPALGYRTAKSGHWLRGDFPTAGESPTTFALTMPETEGISRVFAEVASQAPVSSKLRLEEIRLQPGATLDVETVKTALICEMAQGQIETVIDGETVTHGTGDVWACPVTRVSAPHINTGPAPAKMRIVHLIAE